MMVFKKSIPRRTFLRGLGTTLALPLLDGMIPAFAVGNDAGPVSRFSIVYVPNGKIMDKWTPAATGAGYEMTPTLEPLRAFRDRFLVVTGLDHNAADPLPGEGATAPHERAAGTYLTGVHPKRDGHVGTSIDQLVAQELGKQTQLASLELGLHNPDVVGQCEKDWNCAFLNTLSWKTPTTPLPSENQPRLVFERLFGETSSTDSRQRVARMRKDQSLLDSAKDSAASLMRGLGPEDRNKVAEYLDAIRDVERRIQMAEAQSARELPRLDRPAGIPSSFDEHAKLMFDLQVIAFQADLTRVTTFMMGAEQGNRTFREIGVPDSHHGLSHHQFIQAKIDKVSKIDLYHSQLFAYYLEKLESTPDGDGSLLDRMMVQFGSGLSDGNEHLVQNLPVLLVGGRSMPFSGGRHIRVPEKTPMTNLYLSILDTLGVPVEKFGDSTGELNLLSI